MENSDSTLPGRQLVPDPVRLRLRMVHEQLERQGISDAQVLDAMSRVPRHCFVPEALWVSAYSAFPLSIGHGQTISQPYVVAFMSEQLHTSPGMRVLEIGTGSGYQAAVLAAMGVKVFSIERVPALHNAARERLRNLGVEGVTLRLADGTLGWPEEAPFDRIIVTAGGPGIPPPLLRQLANPGIMLIPVGDAPHEQRLVRVVRKEGRLSANSLGSVNFVNLVGSHGWARPA